MAGFCRGCGWWKQTPVLKSLGWCEKRKDVTASVHSCSMYEVRPLSLSRRLGYQAGSLWERFGAPIYDAATSSRKTLEMFILFVMMMAAFFYMLTQVYPVLKKVMFQVFLPNQ